MASTFIRRCPLPVSAAEALAWHERDGALERLLPPWENARVVRRSGGVRDGAETEIVLKLGPIPLRWLARHYGYIAGQQFCDTQISGPFAAWRHEHRFQANGDDACTLEDHVEYQLPLGPLGALFGGGMVEQKLERMFAYRQAVTSADLASHARFADRERLRVAITGASGLVGGALTAMLTTGGHQVIRLHRSGKQPKSPASELLSDAIWQVETGDLEISPSEPVDAVIHLAGENIAGKRWNPRVMQAIRDSRVAATRKLCEALARRATPPRTLICASAIGYYGNRGEEALDEESAAGAGFLADVCRDWEAATAPARDAGIRVVNARFGIILSPRGGALANMLTPFQLGGGGRIGDGGQFWSWIALDDVVGALHHALLSEDLAGPLNVVSPQPLTNRDFTRTLGRVLRRPTLLPLPGFAARLALGKMADELLLASAKVEPKRLVQTGYRFRFPELEPALRHLLGR